jgi:hypothetical protein
MVDSAISVLLTPFLHMLFTSKQEKQEEQE